MAGLNIVDGGHLALEVAPDCDCGLVFGEAVGVGDLEDVAVFALSKSDFCYIMLFEERILQQNLAKDSLGLRVLSLDLLNAVGDSDGLALVDPLVDSNSSSDINGIDFQNFSVFPGNFVVVDHRSELLLPHFVASGDHIYGAVALDDCRAGHLVSEHFVFLQQHRLTIL